MIKDYFVTEDSDEDSDSEVVELTNLSPHDDELIEPHQAPAAFDYESDTSNDEPLDVVDEGNNGWMDEELDDDDQGSPGGNDGGNKEASPQPVNQQRQKR
jgi:hypothetical protein